MSKLLSKAYAENQYVATQKKNKQALNAREVEERARAEHVSELKALRLAKEAADKEAADVLAAEKADAKLKKVQRLPQVHRS